MAERPILFSGPMVRAILEGRKTQTRRIVKPPFEMIGNGYLVRPDGHGGRFGPYPCPYGQPGDRLWVRESFCPFPPDRHSSGPNRWVIIYAADATQAELSAPDDYNPMLYNYERWTPSIHMPRWASRINLEVVSVRVQRLQDISEEDAMAEGVDFDHGWEDEPGFGYLDYLSGHDNFSLLTAVESFRTLWDSINADRGHGWDKNEWVWAVEFKRLPA